MEYFKVETISPSIKSITDLTTVRSFLIEGEKAAVLVDTGTGVGHLAEFVKAITAKPLRASTTSIRGVFVDNSMGLIYDCF